MNDLLNVGQKIKVVPKNFKISNKGTISRVLENGFVIELDNPPDGLMTKFVMEFFSPTPHGMLYFESAIATIDGDNILVVMPKKHRFLQRRAFSRNEFIEKAILKKGKKTIEMETMDLFAGGMKVKVKEILNIEKIYDSVLRLQNTDIECKFEPLKIEKTLDGYDVSGRFVEISMENKIRIIQLGMRKEAEQEKTEQDE